MWATEQKYCTSWAASPMPSTDSGSISLSRKAIGLLTIRYDAGLLMAGER